MPDNRTRHELTASGHPHRRHNPLNGRWILVSVDRRNRPWSGRVESPTETSLSNYDAECYLCPGNQRAGGVVNPEYEDTFVFVNDYAALRPEIPQSRALDGLLIAAESQPGTCHVICFSPRHDLTLATMTAAQIRPVVDLWAREIEELGGIYEWVQIFENRGKTMGASNSHPHGQVWASQSVPTEPAVEDQRQMAYYQRHSRHLLVDYAELELERQERIVASNGEWLVVVPFWATWPYETLLLPIEPVDRLSELSESQRSSLALILSDLLPKYDNLFQRPFPYSMGWHGAPRGQEAPGWQIHAHFYPALLRANVQKFMVGYEMLAEAQRDITPEEAAEQLSALSTVHYSMDGSAAT